DGVAHGVARDPLETGVLHPLLKIGHVLVGEWPRLAHVATERNAGLMDQHGRAQHLVIAERITNFSIILECGNGVGDVRNELSLRILDALQYQVSLLHVAPLSSDTCRKASARIRWTASWPTAAVSPLAAAASCKASTAVCRSNSPACHSRARPQARN